MASPRTTRITSCPCGSSAGTSNYGWFQKGTNGEVMTMSPELFSGLGWESDWWERGLHRPSETSDFPSPSCHLRLLCFLDSGRWSELEILDIWVLLSELEIRKGCGVCVCMHVSLSLSSALPPPLPPPSLCVFFLGTSSTKGGWAHFPSGNKCYDFSEMR